MKLRAHIPFSLDSPGEDTLLAGMHERFAVNLMGARIGTARVLGFTDEGFEIEIEVDEGVNLDLDSGTYVAAGPGVDTERPDDVL